VDCFSLTLFELWFVKGSPFPTRDKFSNVSACEAVEYLVIKGIQQKSKLKIVSSIKGSTVHRTEDTKWTHIEQM